MQLFSSKQIHEWDAFTIAREPVASIDLMERAARECTDFIIANFILNKPVKIFCGKGNNGGDGLAIARQLLQAGYEAQVYILEFGAIGTPDFQANLHNLHELSKEIHFIQSAAFFPALNKNDVIIDALYGSGLNRPLEGLNAELVAYLNHADASLISIDIPSGMFIEKSSVGYPVIRARHTLTFQSLKLCFLMAENEQYAGEVHMLDIGLHPQYLEQTFTQLELITGLSAARIFKPRKAFAHKGNFGHALLIAGNDGKMGAALLTAKACLRSGVGLLTVNIPETCQFSLNAYVPEAMCNSRNISIDFEKYSVVGIGPGLGLNEETNRLVLEVISSSEKPLVIDADAINIIAQHPEWMDNITAGSVITPHPKEFERLFGKTENEFDRMNLALEKSLQYNLVIVVKGHHTLIAANGKGWFNTTGNAGMSKGGSGDALTGIITALLAQNYTALDAAILGVYLHGLAADIAVENQSLESLLAGDLIENIGYAFNAIG